ncbi:hypothetical protein H257_12232 [Aphanomyces astaci]|uniref:Uncharacterized protein n=1 Tax=Aphanomyces astaci TaxID=112090 RepID=W4FZJ1_APHAT|nr:hypothetical protein H257_12232 [Aphanomyces astaci]ETV72895.1 hypothetical protein H257_12232 [Aphanomyces astaci]|eukprot:XP_009837681.1 hypothetical protein H257_12232 [Aphanomyces astaci]
MSAAAATIFEVERLEAKFGFLYKWLVQCSPSGNVPGSHELVESDVKALLQLHEPNDATLDAKLNDVLANQAKTLPLAAFQQYMVTKRPIDNLEEKLKLPSSLS